MRHMDMRKLPAAAQEERRRQVIGLRQRGLTYKAIAEQVGLSRTGVIGICQRFAAEGASGLVSKPRGRRPDEQRLLDAAQEVEVQGLIRRHTPDELGLPFALWSRTAVGALIARRCGVVLAVRTVGKYLARWGFPAQRPIRRAYEQDPAAVRRWLRRDYPAIVARAKQARGVLFWGDETGLRSDDARGRGYVRPARPDAAGPGLPQAGRAEPDLGGDQPGRVALDGRRWRGERPNTHSLPPASGPGGSTQNLPDPGPPASAPRPIDPGLAGRTPIRDRGLLPALVQSGTQPG
jgi:transposase